MPKVRRRNVPRAVFWHLTQRVRDREIPERQLRLFGEWLGTDPTVPEGE